jgi:hypothetical protein
MAYNFNANQFYSKPNQGFQPRNAGYGPAFGHQVNASPYYPANAYGLPAAQALPLPRNVTPMAPFPPLPVPGHFLNPANSDLPAGVNAPFRMNTTVGSGQSLATPRPQVQQHFYTLPAVKEPPSRKKSIKKFLLITSAVVTGVFATAASVMGLMWMFWPGFVELGKNIGTHGASKAANAIKEWKKPGPLLQRAVNVYEAYTRQSESSAKSGWQQIKDLFKSKATKEAEAKAAEQAREKAMAEQKEAGSRLATLLNGLTAQDIDATKDFFKKLGLNLENLTSSKHWAEVINQVEPEKFTAVLDPLVSTVLKDVRPEVNGFLNKLGKDLEHLTSPKNMAEVINGVDHEKVTTALRPLVSDLLKELKPELEKLTSSKNLAEVINQVDHEKVTAALKPLVSDLVNKLEPQLEKLTSSENLAEVINDVIKQVEPEKVSAILESLVPAVLNAALPEDAAEILAAARKNGSSSQLAEGFWNLLTEEQQTGIYNKLSSIATQGMDEYTQSFFKNYSFWKSSPSTSKKTPSVNPQETSPKDVISNKGMNEVAQSVYSFWKSSPSTSTKPPSVNPVETILETVSGVKQTH